MQYKITSTLTLMLCMVCLMFTAVSFAGTTTTYVYDDLDRLKEVQHADGNGIRYEYDKIGNLESKTPFGNVFAIAASASEGGSISPMGTLTITAGSSKTFFFAPLNGYFIADVVVDGVSYGAITTYPFNNIAANHTIAATFAPNGTTSFLPVKIARSTPVYFSTLQAAYEAAVVGEVIMVQSNFTGGLITDRDIAVTIAGGYNAFLTSNPGSTTLSSITYSASRSITFNKVFIKYY